MPTTRNDFDDESKGRRPLAPNFLIDSQTSPEILAAEEIVDYFELFLGLGLDTLSRPPYPELIKNLARESREPVDPVRLDQLLAELTARGAELAAAEADTARRPEPSVEEDDL